MHCKVHWCSCIPKTYEDWFKEQRLSETHSQKEKTPQKQK